MVTVTGLIKVVTMTMADARLGLTPNSIANKAVFTAVGTEAPKISTRPSSGLDAEQMDDGKH